MFNWDDLSEILDLLHKYKGRISGLLIGLISSILIIQFGIIPAIFIITCMGIGYYLGFRYDNRQDLQDVLNDIFPPHE
ncbi:DUF2273 domain-containing protein [Halanaerobacter jeridensis]|uniref:Membrane protein n=1 Tax=Halanaerobacter jeridensis TaxID=706427 RepID=A0A939BNH1_9FIRM|nr:DUF2273 domain-containing protein [Halanaerobacter jeridensis]MBM7555233.1 putative membrane protein [Halanaerobacter jeridensis]